MSIVVLYVLRFGRVLTAAVRLRPATAVRSVPSARAAPDTSSGVPLLVEPRGEVYSSNFSYTHVRQMICTSQGVAHAGDVGRNRS
jgi:hypothetical protein